MSSTRFKWSRWLALVGTLLAGAVLVVGCGSSDSSGGSDGSGASASVDGKKVTLVACGAANPWCKVFNERVDDMLTKAGADVTILENDFDAVTAVQQANQAISQKPDLLILFPANDKALVGSVKKAKAAGIDVMYLDSHIDDSAINDIVTQVIANNPELGKFAGESLIAGLKEADTKEGNIAVITGTAGTQMVDDRQAGFEKAMMAAPEYRVVEVQDGDWDGVKSGKIAQQLFAKYASKGGLAGLRVEADYMAVPVIAAAKQAGLSVGSKKGDLVVVSTNCSKVGMESMRAGELYATGTEDAWTQGEYTADTAIQVLKGEPVAKTVVVPEYKVDKKTIDKFEEVCSKG